MGKTSSAAKNRYNEKAYDRVHVVVTKGQKEVIAAFATARGESLNGFINRAIAEAMERENAEQEE
ncbi:MAG: antitoxin [Oscillospiraceae bacterium]|nr:antitoxin [Oscillospiraceae bacterium]